jgi:hypothetical protein
MPEGIRQAELRLVRCRHFAASGHGVRWVIEPAPTSRTAFTEYIAAETQRWAQVVKDAKLTPQ